MKFSSLGLIAPLEKAIQEKGYTEPSEIQVKAIPVLIEGGDLLASSQTGTGKTAAFVLPMIQKIEGLKEKKDYNKNTFNKSPSNRNARGFAAAPSGLVLAPTREIASQIAEAIAEYGKYSSIRAQVVYGGVPIPPQIRNLSKGTDIIVATPGRLLDLMDRGNINLSRCSTVVFDEADRMLDMGFIRDMKKIVSYLPRVRQTLLFSATFSKSIRKLALEYLTHPVELEIAKANSTVDKITQVVHPIDKNRKEVLLDALISKNDWKQTLVFTRTKHRADKLVKFLLRQGRNAAAIHGNKSQNNRIATLKRFKSGECEVLVATDVASRGIDIKDLEQVVNFDLPSSPEDYVHRIGRTGRAGAPGLAVSFYSEEEKDSLVGIEKLIKQTLPVNVLHDFTPTFEYKTMPRQGGRKMTPSRKVGRSFKPKRNKRRVHSR